MDSRGAKKRRKSNNIVKGKQSMKTIRPSLIIIHVFLCSIFLPRTGMAQLEADYWMFGHNQYVYFNHATYPDSVHYPSLTSQFFPGSGCTSYTDKHGNLLFYGAGGAIYDRNFQSAMDGMANSTGIFNPPEPISG